MFILCQIATMIHTHHFTDIDEGNPAQLLMTPTPMSQNDPFYPPKVGQMEYNWIWNKF